jgi:broad specificity phosphatase PhoE
MYDNCRKNSSEITLLLMRHGETHEDILGPHNISDTATLSSQGVARINQACDNLRGLRLHKVFSSPKERCVQSASIIAEVLKLELLINSSLGDISKGILTGVPDALITSTPLFSKLNEARHKDKWNFSNDAYGIESYKSGFLRFCDFVSANLNRLSPSLLLTHSGNIRAILWGGYNMFLDKIPFAVVYKLRCRYLNSLSFIDYKELLR